MDFVQKSNFLIPAFFTEIISEKIVFNISERKEWFYEVKIETLKRAKNGHFPKGLVHGFCPKIELSLIAVFHRNYVRKDLFPIFSKENRFFWPKNWSFNKRQKMNIF